MCQRVFTSVFGFSCWAVAARYFVAQWKAEQNLATQLAAPQAAIEIKFVGLFDTVSSVGYGLGFGSNVQELGLDLGGVPKKVVHLTAANEYRKNFALTTIDSSLGVGGGFECKLPGVHSDIGGGYAELEDEVRNVRLYHRDILIEQGWYLDGTNGTDNQIPILNDTWAVGRRLIPLHYQFITLAIMLELADKSDVKFKSLEGKFLNYVIPPKLKPVADYLMGEVRMQKTEVTLPPEHAWVRNAYLHRSAHTYRAKLDSPKRIKRDKLNGVAFAGREVNKEFQREVFPDNKPQSA